MTRGQRPITQAGVTSNRTASGKLTRGGVEAVGAAGCGDASATVVFDAIKGSTTAAVPLTPAAPSAAVALALDREAFSHSDDA